MSASALRGASASQSRVCSRASVAFEVRHLKSRTSVCRSAPRQLVPALHLKSCKYKSRSAGSRALANVVSESRCNDLPVILDFEADELHALPTVGHLNAVLPDGGHAAHRQPVQERHDDVLAEER